mmetsp:Transcript_91931/g.127617  ORF Transcript_91931/g.127617 Transcript_91931/m.127617 type:complete len:215 (-) Transcript_91931:691-1335(-)
MCRSTAPGGWPRTWVHKRSCSTSRRRSRSGAWLRGRPCRLRSRSPRRPNPQRPRHWHPAFGPRCSAVSAGSPMCRSCWGRSHPMPKVKTRFPAWWMSSARQSSRSSPTWTRADLSMEIFAPAGLSGWPCRTSRSFSRSARRSCAKSSKAELPRRGRWTPASSRRQRFAWWQRLWWLPAASNSGAPPFEGRSRSSRFWHLPASDPSRMRFPLTSQ